ncbi:hypothetical protein [Alicyclobacillus sacchari]|uniref:hypothetical protein n=1 Tax=Alicyclobacillus sacchari TaxID=392010 RepID=UPI0024E0FF08|nr:hypothetical protein [Alicyclobacillus sacchari]
MAKELQKHVYTCPECNFHFRVDARTRVELTLDADICRDRRRDYVDQSAWLPRIRDQVGEGTKCDRNGGRRAGGKRRDRRHAGRDGRDGSRLYDGEYGIGRW